MAKMTKSKKKEIFKIVEEIPANYNIHLDLDTVEFDMPTITYNGIEYKICPIDLEKFKKLEELEKKYNETLDWKLQIDMIAIATDIPYNILEKMGQHLILEIGTHIIRSTGRSKKKEKKSG